MLRITLDEGNFSELSGRMIDALANPSRTMRYWAAAVAKRARKNAESHSKGGMFWHSIAEAVDYQVDSNRATIFCEHFAARHKQEGGEIRAKNARALTIPIHRLAQGKRASRLEDEGYDLFRPKGTNILATEQNGELIPLYALVKSVRQSPEPWWPDDTLVLELGRREIERIIK